MPLYVYADTRGHTQEIVHRMLYGTGVVCSECGAEMHKVPQALRFNWNGDYSRHPLHPTIKRLIDTADQRRDQYLQEHEEHERRTAQENANRSVLQGIATV